MKKCEQSFNDDELKKRIREAFKSKPVEANKELADNLKDLSETLAEYDNYKSYSDNLAVDGTDFSNADKARDNIGIRKIEEKLKKFESLLDKKYWDKNILLIMELEIRYGVYNSIGKAVKAVERRKSYLV